MHTRIDVSAAAKTYQDMPLLDGLTKAAFYGLVGLVPLAVYPSALDQAYAIKILLLRLLVLVLLVCWVAAVAAGRPVGRTRLHAPLLAFLGLIMISFAVSVSPRLSIFGEYLRYDGLTMYLTYVLIFILAAQLSSFGLTTGLLRALSLTSGAVSLYALFQRSGVDILSWGSSFEGRALSTLGNPVMLGGYLALALPITLSLFLEARRREEKAVLGLVFLLDLLGTLATVSRGAWLAALVGIAIVAAALPQDRRRPALLLGGAAVAAALLVSLLFAGISSGVLERLTAAVTPGDLGIGNRLEIWKSAGAMVAARPLTGFGPGTFKVAFQSHETLRLAQGAGLTSAIDEAHNFALHMAATLGVPALLAFVFFVVLFLLIARREAVGAGNRLLIAGVAAGVVAYLVSLATGVAVVMPYLMWLLMGLVAGGTGQDKADIVRRGRKALTAVGIAVTFVVFITGSAVAVRHFNADMLAGAARTVATHGLYEQAAEAMEKATSLNPFYAVYPRDLARAYETAARVRQSRPLLDKSIDAHHRAIAVSPLNADSYVSLGQTYMNGARAFDRTLFAEARRVLRKAVSLKPLSWPGRGLLGAAELELQHGHEASNNLNWALRLNPNDAQARYELGRYHEMANHPGRALASYAAALEIREDFTDAVEAIRRITDDQKREEN